MDEENLKDAIAKAAEKHLTANPHIVSQDDTTEKGVPISLVCMRLRNQTRCFLFDVMKSVASSEAAATPEGITAIANVAATLEKYLHC